MTKKGKNMKILLTGANGQLGVTLQDVLREHDLILTDRDELDITDEQGCLEFVVEQKPDIIINAAAYTAVDQAEEEVDLARKINADGPRNLVVAAKAVDALFFQISTDFVFDGKKGTSYTESDEPNPLNKYGLTKLEGEKAVEEAGEKYFTLRTAWLYSPYGKNFVKTFIKLGHEKSELTVVADEIGCPTYAYDLANAIKYIIDNNITKYGLYHFAGTGQASWFEFAKEIVAMSGGTANILPTTAKEYGLPAKRPAYSVLDCSKIESLGVKTRPWKESLKECIEKLKVESL